MGRVWSSSSAFNWPDFDFLSSSTFRWPEINLSSWWGPQLFRWPDLDFSVVDSICWSFITAFESLALVAMLCFFFLFCGCTL
ncbi:hypothetical protein ACHQM5_026199 [Ranunculus cassubicifolius]